MFTPLAIHKNRIDEIDRFDNTNVVNSTTATKAGGLAIPAQNSTQANNVDGTVVVQAWPSTDYLACTGRGGGEKWHLWCAENVPFGTWWQLCIPTADNQLNVGGYTDYGTGWGFPENYVGPSGVLKGQIGISFRTEPAAAGTNYDGIVLINSGSIYDWNDPQPIRIAYSVDMTAGVARASINGETADVLQVNRKNNVVAANPLMFTNLTNPTQEDVTCTFGYSVSTYDEAIPSGSFSEISYYTSSLLQDELNVITAQPFGSPSNILSNKQPQIHYVVREENKEQTAGNTITGQLNGVFAYPNEGTEQISDYSQLKTVSSYTDFVVTSGSAYDGGNNQWRERL